MKTLSVLCIFALLSANLVSGSVIKKGLNENSVMKKNLVETGCESGIDVKAVGTVTFSNDGSGATPPPTGVLPPPGGAASFTGISTTVLASSGQSVTTLPGAGQDKTLDCTSSDETTGCEYAAGVACSKKSYCFCGSVDYSHDRCVTENNH
jgi:hypothetical protein